MENLTLGHYPEVRIWHWNIWSVPVNFISLVPPCVRLREEEPQVDFTWVHIDFTWVPHTATSVLMGLCSTQSMTMEHHPGVNIYHWAIILKWASVTGLSSLSEDLSLVYDPGVRIYHWATMLEWISLTVLSSWSENLTLNHHPGGIIYHWAIIL